MNAPAPRSIRFAAATAVLLAASGLQAMELRGFRGVEWGESPARLGSEAVKAEGHQGSACYRRATENLIFGDTPLADVRYCFKEGRFHMAIIDAPVAAPALQQELVGTYGRPTQVNELASRWGNRASSALAELTSTGGRATLRIQSNPSQAKTQVSDLNDAAMQPVAMRSSTAHQR